MSAEEILAFWFGTEADDALVAREKAELWWGKNNQFDQEIRTRFAGLLEKGARGELAAWEASPDGQLALILLTDQFPRCIYRDSPKAFTFDAKALSWCRHGLARGVDRSLRPIERVFFYLPLEHCEAIDCQERSVELFRRLLEEVRTTRATDSAAAEVFAEFLDFAVRHRDIIARFGRFPHRNKILGRDSTPEEVAFLETPGSSF
jgi:uncharacterized protein (DUF924 family)